MDPDHHRRLLALFDALVEQGPAEQAREISALQAEDPALAATLQAMLAVDATASPLDAPVRAVEAGPRLPERYLDLGLLGVGGMGEVRRVQDLQLQRTVAMKIVSDPAPGPLERFADEARVVAQLQHPGIVPVHELGRLADGRLFFTMREVRGETWAARLAAGAGDAEDRRAQGFVLRQVAQAVAYAHDSGVIHRDLKPANVMVGAFGEVVVLDWGLAKVLAGAAVRVQEVGGTGAGVIMGTPQYMAPEQAMGWGALVGPATDVYALGAMLYTLLAGRPPYGSGCTPAQVALEDPAPLPADLPAPLVALCAAAMVREPTARLATAGAFAARLSDWLTGAADRARAEGLVAEAQALGARLAAQRAALAAIQARAAAALAEVPLHAPAEAKAAGWALEAEAAARAADLQVAEDERLQRLRMALSLAPDLPAAHRLLAAHHQAAVAAAERARDPATAAVHLAALARHDDGRLAAWRAGEAWLTVVSDPPGAEVSLWEWRPAGRRLEAVPRGSLGVTPLRHQAVAGRYLLRLSHPDHSAVAAPVCLRRAEDQVLRLRLPGRLPPDLCYVPAGPFEAGGDPDAPDAFPAAVVALGGFVAQRDPVTHGGFVEFLNDLIEMGREQEASGWAPVDTTGGRAGPLYGRDPAGRFVAEAGLLAEPVVHVTWFAAQAWCAWRAARDGRPWRLLHELEWEKAARGPDGRAFPWGDGFDPSFACMLQSQPGAPRRCAVHAFPGDESPYGLRGLGGNVRDWCLNRWAPGAPEDPPDLSWPARDEGLRAMRGGSFHSLPQFCRAATRFAAAPGLSYNSGGFRAGFSWPPGEGSWPPFASS